jgi:uncharacterized protein (TIGR02611 family)
MSVLTRRFNGGVLAARRARRAVRDELSGELPERTLDDVELLVSELATNSVRHGGCDEDAELRVETDVTPSCIRIRLCDTGSGFAEPRAEPSPSGRRRRLRPRSARPDLGPLGHAAQRRLLRLVRGSARTDSRLTLSPAATVGGMAAAPERPRREPSSEPKLVRKLRARQEEHRRRGKLYRALFVLLGLVVLAVGIAMLALPGPAFVVIPIGLAILSLEFAWAERLLEKALIKGEEARRKAADASPAQKILSAVGVVLGVAAAAAAAVLWDIPYLPV